MLTTVDETMRNGVRRRMGWLAACGLLFAASITDAVASEPPGVISFGDGSGFGSPTPAGPIRQTGAVASNPPLPGYGPHPHAPTIHAMQPLDSPTSTADMEPGVPYYGPDGVIRERVTFDNWWDDDGWLERIFVDAVTNTWVRFEFLYWRPDPPGRVTLGAPVAGVPDPTQPFGAFDAAGNFFAVRVPTTQDLDADSTSGVRVTYGVPLTFGTWETSFFGLEQSSDDGFAADLARGDIDRIVISLLQNGDVSSTQTLESFDVSYFQDHVTDVWGFDTVVAIDRNYYFNDYIELKPVAGLRVLSVQESLTQIGVFDNGGTIDPLTSTIFSDTSNFHYGLSVGLRAEIEHPWITVGIEPRISLAVNSSSADVVTENFRGPGDGIVRSGLESDVLTGIFEFKAYGRIPLHEQFNLFVGYDVIFLPHVQRAAQSIYYNDNGASLPPDVRAQDGSDSFMMFGWSIGGEIVF